MNQLHLPLGIPPYLEKGVRDVDSSGQRANRKRQAITVVPCEDRYYTSKEYSKLSPSNMIWLKVTKDARVATVALAESSKKTVPSKIVVLVSVVDKPQVNEVVKVDVDKETEVHSNTTNSALQRIVTRQ